MTFAVGSLVKAREREWVVLPESSEDFLILRPLGGTDAELAGIDTGLEAVTHASFDLPQVSQLGDFRSSQLLRNAIRLGFRSSAGPFRSFGRIAVEPRPYQLVPLLVALKQDTVRMLIADDVGIGKTVEALLIARELLDRAEIQRFSVLCPPHLAEQWQEELREKFHIDAELVLSGTAKRLDRICGNRSVFDVFPFTIVSMDYIKSDSRRDDFIRACPEMVIVDEAHTCAALGQKGKSNTRQQRHQVIRALAKKEDRHVILVTATPHSGNEEGFRSLLALLNADFANLPDSLAGDENRKQRERLAQHFVQRRRADIRHYLKTDTAFPDRLEKEETYQLGKTSPYMQLLLKLLKYAREVVKDSENLSKVRQRVRWWAALGLLRSLASSPAAAAATLRSKSKAITAETAAQVDEISRPLVFDEDADDAEGHDDIVVGSDTADLEQGDDAITRERRRLLDLAREADALQGENDPKLKKVVTLVKGLLKEGHRPILFCRFIATAEYVAEQLREKLTKKETVVCVTGLIAPAEREERIRQLRDVENCVLICTDCLSEGINLQHVFDSVIHYDLSWNPTRHEQREGRVDRFGQHSKEVKVITYWGGDNQIDGVVLNVLIEKHKRIRKATGVSVPVPTSSNAVLEALYEGLLLRNRNPEQMLLFDDDELKPKTKEFDDEWQNAADREQKSRSLFAQHSIKDDEVFQEVAAVRNAIGSSDDVTNFMTTATQALLGSVSEAKGRYRFNFADSSRAVREAIGNREQFFARMDPSVSADEIYLSRTHPIVDGLATYVLDTALDSAVDHSQRSVAARCGVIYTSAVETRTTLLLVRFRYHILTTTKDDTTALLAEDCQLVGFTGAPDKAEWLTQEQADNLLSATPEQNVNDDTAKNFIQRVLTGFDPLRSKLNDIAIERGKELLKAHRRVRQASGRRNVKHDIEPQLPPDVLGLYVFLPLD